MRTRTVLAGGVLVALAVTACSGGSGGSGGANAAVDRAVANDAIAAPGASAAASAASGSAAGGGSAQEDTASVRLSTGAKIRTAQLTVSVRKGTVASRADDAGAIAQRAGGEIDADDRTSGATATASLRLLVPPAELSTVLSALSKLGHEDSRTLSSRDVTTEVADVASRVISARAAIARLTALYARSNKVGDVIAIEGELSQRQADLESLEAQQKALAAQTSFATVTLSLRTAVAVVHHSHPSGFVGGLARGWHAFTAAAAAVATGVATALPFLVLLVLALLAARLLWTRLGRRPTPVPVPSPDPAP